MHRALLVAAAAALVVGGCAKRADSITAAYVSPHQYEAWNCPQLADEAARINSRAMAAAGAQDQKATQDAVVTAIGVVAFWPALFFIEGNGAQAAELARLRGEAEAVEQAAVRKRCGRGPGREAHAQAPALERTVERRAMRRETYAVSDYGGPARLPYGGLKN
jgi:hypothetical protein